MVELGMRGESVGEGGGMVMEMAASRLNLAPA